jgi:hypothetical protein
MRGTWSTDSKSHRAVAFVGDEAVGGLEGIFRGNYTIWVSLHLKSFSAQALGMTQSMCAHSLYGLN